MQPTNVILFVGDHPTSMSASSIGQVFCETIQIIQLLSCVYDKIEAYICGIDEVAASPTNVILFRRRSSHEYVGFIGICQVVCESTLIILYHSRMLDKVLLFWERWRVASPTNVLIFVGDHPTTLSPSSLCQEV